MKKNKIRNIIGLITSIFILLIICIWSYWGVNEAFHEGWYFVSVWENLKLTFIQYLLVPITLIIFSSIGLFRQKIVFVLFFFLGTFSLFFFRSSAGRLLIFLPAILVSLSFYFAEFKYKKETLIVTTTLPFFIILAFGIPQLIRVEKRLNDGDFGSRRIVGNGVVLTWAPQGVGFPLIGTDWVTAKNNCVYLNEKGVELENDKVNVWRLPTRNEIVRSLSKNNVNSKGLIDINGNAKYSLSPDKETPLWNPHSQIIYYWTCDEQDENKAFLVSYNGVILSRNKNSGPNYQGYRCVKE